MCEYVKCVHNSNKNALRYTSIAYTNFLHHFDMFKTNLIWRVYYLHALNAQLAEAGAGEEIERLVYASEEMKGLLMQARGRLEKLY